METLLLKIKNYLAQLFGPKKKQTELAPPPVEKPISVELPVPPKGPASWEEPPVLPGTIQDKVLKIAKAEIGVKELTIGSNKVVEKYHAYSTIDNKRTATDDVPWCASFMCYVLETAGLLSTNSKSARSYEKYGTPVKDPKPGDIVVFWRESKSSGKGHVAFFIEKDKNGDIRCLGGNQSNSVCIATYAADKVLAYRRI